MDTEIIRRLRAALPMVREWIDLFVQDHASQARAISSLDFKRLPAFFHQELLEQTKVVTVERVPFPPLSRFGLPEFAAFEHSVLEQTWVGGVTFQDTIFLKVGQPSESESLHFHELVHVVQWNQLDADNFLLAYAIGLVQFGYRESPLEQMAYSLQAQFEEGSLQPTLATATEIEKRTEAIWGQVAPILAAAAASDT
ncbi:MAG: hypothetical protein CDV28_10261 [Candidatus Electronema aureum]|uniref:DUF4157 domain-containing protein n=1 Tax=Candidatus Electronema aureum TaxID=2005002 RepID=A0A521G4I8_9BACT|nr:MAG: hypothetical protein CDV28_10261 [Candidatus Electronema aureum]